LDENGAKNSWKVSKSKLGNISIYHTISTKYSFSQSCICWEN